MKMQAEPTDWIAMWRKWTISLHEHVRKTKVETHMRKWYWKREKDFEEGNLSVLSLLSEQEKNT